MLELDIAAAQRSSSHLSGVVEYDASAAWRRLFVLADPTETRGRTIISYSPLPGSVISTLSMRG
jgi:hypothetical protein